MQPGDVPTWAHQLQLCSPTPQAGTASSEHQVTVPQDVPAGHILGLLGGRVTKPEPADFWLELQCSKATTKDAALQLASRVHTFELSASGPGKAVQGWHLQQLREQDQDPNDDLAQRDQQQPGGQVARGGPCGSSSGSTASSNRIVLITGLDAALGWNMWDAGGNPLALVSQAISTLP